MSDSLRSVSDQRLLTRFRDLAQRGCAIEAELLAHLGEIDRRRLYASEGYTSLFRYCVDALNFSEAVAYLRIGVARRALELPVLLEAIRHGHLHLTGARLLTPHLTTANAHELIAAAHGKTKAQIEQLLADRSPKPDRPARIQKLPRTETQASRLARSCPDVSGPPALQSRPTSLSAPHPDRAHSEPLGRARYRVSVTLDESSHAQLEDLRAWLRHQIPDGDIAAILARAIALLHAKEDKRKSARTSSPQPRKPASTPPSRHIPAEIRRAVWKRDAGSCTYRSPAGRRCDAREFLEFDHAEPWQRVRTHSIGNLRLRCRTHNEYAACQAFGEEHMVQFRRQSASASSAADRRERPARGTRSGTSSTGDPPSDDQPHRSACSPHAP